MLGTEFINGIRVFEKIVFSSGVIFGAKNLNCLARDVRISKLIDRTLIKILSTEFSFCQSSSKKTLLSCLLMIHVLG